MTTKTEALQLAAVGVGCLGKAYDDEPVFILRAQDQFAPLLLEIWAAMVEDARASVIGKTTLARAEAKQMRAWQQLHGSKVPD